MFHFDVAGCMAALQEAAGAELDAAAKWFVDDLKRELGNTSGFPRAWAESLIAKAESIREDAGGVLSAKVGLQGLGGSGDYLFVRAMAIDSGIGTAAGQATLQTKPGASVWNNALDAKKTSSARWFEDSELAFHGHVLGMRGPAARAAGAVSPWDRGGTHFWQTVIERFQSVFKEYMDHILANFDFSRFCGG